MKLLESIEALKSWQASVSVSTTGFVPTMGALHAGHLSLIEHSRADCQATVVSIYVNPTQFNNPNDLANYPNTLEEDLRQLRVAGVDAVFLPDYNLLYPDGFRYQVEETVFSHELCGEQRPGHFTGVLTVVMKLLNLVKPDRAYFGEKDYQQLSLVRGMVEAFFLDTEIVGCPIVREEDGLAMSSRNLNLTVADRSHAPRFSRILASACGDSEAVQQLQSDGFKVDYVRTIDGRRFGAVLMGSEERPVRLIDNVRVG
ncbi:MAG: pantoate--beta-alanine ligase [Proteobacteria bacterium]|nr:pantoate--beta-alanine ligase [Pseudomonadota bacterium]